VKRGSNILRKTKHVIKFEKKRSFLNIYLFVSLGSKCKQFSNYTE
jgi:hypothetical protein